jgi:hypothetical protein
MDNVQEIDYCMEDNYNNHPNDTQTEKCLIGNAHSDTSWMLIELVIVLMLQLILQGQ